MASIAELAEAMAKGERVRYTPSNKWVYPVWVNRHVLGYHEVEDQPYNNAADICLFQTGAQYDAEEKRRAAEEEAKRKERDTEDDAISALLRSDPKATHDDAPVQVLSINEVRARLGYEPVKWGENPADLSKDPLTLSMLAKPAPETFTREEVVRACQLACVTVLENANHFNDSDRQRLKSAGNWTDTPSIAIHQVLSEREAKKGGAA